MLHALWQWECYHSLLQCLFLLSVLLQCCSLLPLCKLPLLKELPYSSGWPRPDILFRALADVVLPTWDLLTRQLQLALNHVHHRDSITWPVIEVARKAQKSCAIPATLYEELMMLLKKKDPRQEKAVSGLKGSPDQILPCPLGLVCKMGTITRLWSSVDLLLPLCFPWCWSFLHLCNRRLQFFRRF